MRGLVGAIDQGTTSTRFLIFDRKGAIVGSAQKEHEQIYPKPGWVEHNATEIWRNTVSTMADALASAGLSASDLVSFGVTNQRETTLLWDRVTGEPLGNAIVWQDTRTDGLVTELGKGGGQDRLRGKTGLPLATYFSGLKLRWLLENTPGARARAASGEALFGTIDSWLVWNITGGPRGGLHITDVTNASRTQMMNSKRSIGTGSCFRFSMCRGPACRRSSLLPRLMEKRRRRSPAFPSAASSAISTRRCSARLASSLARRKTHTARAASCS